MSQASSQNNVGFRYRLARWREIFFAQKYRFDLGQSFMVVINFSLLLITASDKLMIFFGILHLRSLLVFLIPAGFIAVWLFGFFMDKVVRAGQMAERQQIKRSEVWTHHNEQMDRIEREIRKLKGMLARKSTV